MASEAPNDESSQELSERDEALSEIGTDEEVIGLLQSARSELPRPLREKLLRAAFRMHEFEASDDERE